MSSRTQPPIRFIARFVVPALLLGTAATLLVFASRDALANPREARVVPVAVAASASPASPDDAAGGLQAPGWIEPAPFATEVPALREGTVAEVLVLEGARVAKGDTVARLEGAAEAIALKLAEAELAAAEAEIASSEAALSAAERTRVLAVDAERALRLAESGVREAAAMLARVAAEIAEAEAAHAEARDEFERKERLVPSGGAAAGEVRRLGLKADALRAKLEAVRADQTVREAKFAAARADLVAAEVRRAELIEETRALGEARAALAAARAARDAKSALRDAAALAVARGTVTAPCDGVVLVRSARPGVRTGAGEPLATLYDPASLQVRCDVPLRDAAKLVVGMRAEIRVDALPDRVFAGAVVRIVPLGDVQKNTVQCKVAIESPDEALRPDMLARVRLFGGAAGGAASSEGVIAPEEALRAPAGGRAALDMPRAASQR
ncbi:MAG: efflux RND transporter periplasmic adaptor subunit, partial [Phycisphaerales bacterium]